MYPSSDIDKTWALGETPAVDPELREALGRLTADLQREIRSGDAETRDTLDRLAADLRGEIRSGDAETRAHVDAVEAGIRNHVDAVEPGIRAHVDAAEAGIRNQIDAAEAGIRAYVDASATETRRHSHVIAESVRSDIRSLAELMGISNERSDQRFGEPAGRSDGLEGRVLRLEARVTSLEDDRSPRRPRRRR